MYTSDLDAVMEGLEEIRDLLFMVNLLIVNGGDVDIDEAIIMANNGIDIHDSLPGVMPMEYLDRCQDFLIVLDKFKTLI